MLKIGVLVSGGGTNLQAILDAIDAGEITNAKVDIVISNNASAYALERARKHDIEAACIAPKDYPDREAFHKALLAWFTDPSLRRRERRGGRKRRWRNRR